MKRPYNFNPGPAALPRVVLEQAQKEFLDYNGTGVSVMELSHRSTDYEMVHNQAQEHLKELLGLSEDYIVLFLQGGASLQFTMVPMNFLEREKLGNYILTGVWSEKALKEGMLFGRTHIGGSSDAERYSFIPSIDQITIDDQDAYVHITSNNTIYGTQWQSFPRFVHAPLIADMSSDILSRPIPIGDFDLIYAGAQKNLGPSGVTVVIIKQNLLVKSQENLATMLNYQTYSENNSLYNTPPTFGVYMLGLVLDWIKGQGGLAGLARQNKVKAELLYEIIDASDGFYKGHARVDSRSHMNVTFTLPSEDLTSQFLTQAKEEGFLGLAGHRLVGGCRASIYNAVPFEACEALARFMSIFRNNH